MVEAQTKNRQLVPAAEQITVQRALLAWLNQYEGLPVRRIEYEFLAADRDGMALSTIQGAYKSRQYILGGYEAQYQFRVIYRAAPGNNNARLAVDEALNGLAIWAEGRQDLPDLGDGRTARRIQCISLASVLAVYDDGTADSQVQMSMTYEVMP